VKEYDVVIDGISHTMLLDQEDLVRYPGATPVSAKSSPNPAPDRPAGVEPPRSGAGSGMDAWVAFAREKGATDADLVDADGKALTRDELADKYAAAPA